MSLAQVSSVILIFDFDVSAYFSFGGNERNSLFFVMGNCCKCLFLRNDYND